MGRSGWSRACGAFWLAGVALACGEAAPPAAPPVPVEIAPASQRDVRVMEGVRRHHGGHRRRRDPRAGRRLSALARLPRRARWWRRATCSSRIDARPFRAALDQARGDLGARAARARQGRAGRGALHAARARGRRQPAGARQRASRPRAPDAPRCESEQAVVEKAQLDLELHARCALADRRHRRRRQCPDRRSGRALRSEAAHRGLAGRSDPGVGADQRARVHARSRGDPRIARTEGADRTTLRPTGAHRRQRPPAAAGALVVAGREVDPSTGTILFKGEFPNPEPPLRPGQYARVRAGSPKLANGALRGAAARGDRSCRARSRSRWSAPTTR